MTNYVFAPNQLAPSSNVNQGSIPIEYARGAVGLEGFKAWLNVFNFANGQNIIPLQASMRDIGLNTVAGVYIDNSQNNFPFLLVFKGTQFNITVPPGTQGFYPVLCVPGLIDCFGQSDSTLYSVPVWFLNREMLAQDWNSVAGMGDGTTTALPAQLTQAFGTNNSTTSASIQASITGTPGKFTYITGATFCWGPATAANTITATVQDSTAVFALSYQLYVPAIGSSSASNSLALTFTPPLRMPFLGANGKAVMPSIGAGGLGQSCNITGFIA